VKALQAEISANFALFSTQWSAELQHVRTELAQRDMDFCASYERLTSLGAWSSVLEGYMSEGSIAFFREAQNDALVSHVMARLGSWRPALNALRSMMENVVVSAFYMDHPVELAMWSEGRYRIGFRAGLDYLVTHPFLHPFPEAATGIATLRKQYALTSRAVHASGSKFRMTGSGGETMLWSSNAVRLSQWLTAERLAVAGVNTLLIALFRSLIGGASHRGLRKALSFAIGEERRSAIKSQFGVVLFAK